MVARPGGPAAKREPSPEGLGLDSDCDLSAVGAALTSPARTCVIRSEAEGFAVALAVAINVFVGHESRQGRPKITHDEIQGATAPWRTPLYCLQRNSTE
jgi:hypothetical protein